uniref:Uncharacterized protein n=1 Tax=Rhizophora mucronata TaxID=61149 RepID=A0A2P2IGY3_RHIMU
MTEREREIEWEGWKERAPKLHFVASNRNMLLTST